MRRDTHRARAFTHNLRNLGGIHASYDAQDDDFGLIARQRPD